MSVSTSSFCVGISELVKDSRDKLGFCLDMMFLFCQFLLLLMLQSIFQGTIDLTVVEKNGGKRKYTEEEITGAVVVLFFSGDLTVVSRILTN